jgi:hypothetical protein
VSNRHASVVLGKELQPAALAGCQVPGERGDLRLEPLQRHRVGCVDFPRVHVTSLRSDLGEVIERVFVAYRAYRAATRVNRANERYRGTAF